MFNWFNSFFLLKNNVNDVLFFYDLKKISNNAFFQIILSNKIGNAFLILLAIWVQERLYLIESLG